MKESVRVREREKKTPPPPPPGGGGKDTLPPDFIFFSHSLTVSFPWGAFRNVCYAG